jgi:hypothetical protein
MQNKNQLLVCTWIDNEKEHRKFYRRKTIGPVEFNERHYRTPSLIRNYVGFGQSGEVVSNGR